MTNNQTRVLFATKDGDKFWCSLQQAQTLNTLAEINGGGVASIQGYSPSTGYDVRPVNNVQILTAFSTSKLYDRKIKALLAIDFADVKPLLNNPKFDGMDDATLEALFNTRRQGSVNSMQKTLDGVRDDAYRAAHDRCYVHASKGVKVHLITEKMNGIMEPVIDQGYPVADSIMITALELNKTVVKEGVYKAVNSGAPVLMDKAIEKLLNKRSVGLKTFSLKSDNFDTLRIGGQQILSEDIQGLID